MSKDLKRTLIVGQRRVVVEGSKYSYRKALDLSKRVAEVRKAHSIFTKYPMNEEETREKWRKRVEPLLEKEQVRGLGESEEKHLGRLFEVKADAHEIALEILNAVAEVFEMKPVTELEFEDANWLEVRTFLYDVLSLGDIPADEFFPKGLSE